MNDTTRDVIIVAALLGVLYFVSKEIKVRHVIKTLPNSHKAPNKVTKTDNANVGPNTNVAYQTGGQTNFENYEP